MSDRALELQKRYELEKDGVLKRQKRELESVSRRHSVELERMEQRHQAMIKSVLDNQPPIDKDKMQ